jgi:hypothetical protein
MYQALGVLAHKITQYHPAGVVLSRDEAAGEDDLQKCAGAPVTAARGIPLMPRLQTAT